MPQNVRYSLNFEIYIQVVCDRQYTGCVLENTVVITGQNGYDEKNNINRKLLFSYQTMNIHTYNTKEVGVKEKDWLNDPIFMQIKKYYYYASILGWLGLILRLRWQTGHKWRSRVNRTLWKPISGYLLSILAGITFTASNVLVKLVPRLGKEHPHLQWKKNISREQRHSRSSLVSNLVITVSLLWRCFPVPDPWVLLLFRQVSCYRCSLGAPPYLILQYILSRKRVDKGKKTLKALV